MSDTSEDMERGSALYELWMEENVNRNKLKAKNRRKVMSLSHRKEVELSKAGMDATAMRVIKETLYPGASDAEASMIISYCSARNIDPLLKPVHLVPMSVKSGKKDHSGKDIYEWRNVVMPGIALYRIDASRTGQYAGMTEPEFGPVKEIHGIKYPEWCKVTVKKLLDGIIAEFTAKEYWIENYATQKKDTDMPNAMWKKRAYGQLAKCAEAQALRKAFPEAIPHEYTKEEMEGKFFQQEKPREVTATVIENAVQEIKLEVIEDDLEMESAKFMQEINLSQSENELKEVWKRVNRVDFKKDPVILQNLLNEKDKRKKEILLRDEFFPEDVNPDTGEVKK